MSQGQFFHRNNSSLFFKGLFARVYEQIFSKSSFQTRFFADVFCIQVNFNGLTSEFYITFDFSIFRIIFFLPNDPLAIGKPAPPNTTFKFFFKSPNSNFKFNQRPFEHKCSVNRLKFIILFTNKWTYNAIYAVKS